MTRRDAVTILAEQGMRVLCAQIIQDDRTVVYGLSRQFRVIRGLAWNAGAS